MTSGMRLLRRLFLLPIAEAEDRERRLHETRMRTDSAYRTIGNAQACFHQSSLILRDLIAETIERNETNGESSE